MPGTSWKEKMCLSNLYGELVIVLHWLRTECASKLAIAEGLSAWLFRLLDERLCAIGTTGTQDALAGPINVRTREIAVAGERAQTHCTHICDGARPFRAAIPIEMFPIVIASLCRTARGGILYTELGVVCHELALLLFLGPDLCTRDNTGRTVADTMELPFLGLETSPNRDLRLTIARAIVSPSLFIFDTRLTDWNEKIPVRTAGVVAPTTC